MLIFTKLDNKKDSFGGVFKKNRNKFHKFSKIWLIKKTTFESLSKNFKE